MSGGRWTSTRPRRVRLSREQRRDLEAALGRLLLSERERAVLAVVAAHANGAGFAFLLVETIILESGCARRTVFRALDDLCSGDDPLLERESFLRKPDNSPKARSPQGRRGQGASNYRLGRRLREAARLIDPEPAPARDDAAGGTPRIAPPGTPSIADPGTPRIPESGGTPSRGTPETPETPCTSGGASVDPERSGGTPERWNSNVSSLNGGVEVGPAREALERAHAEWAKHHTDHELPADEAAALRELEATFPGSHWLDDHTPSRNEILIDLTGATEEAA